MRSREPVNLMSSGPGTKSIDTGPHMESNEGKQGWQRLKKVSRLTGLHGGLSRHMAWARERIDTVPHMEENQASRGQVTLVP